MSTQELLDIDKNEQVILDIRRHPFGLYAIYGSGIAGIVTLLVVLFFAVSLGEDFAIQLSDSVYGVLFGSLILLTGLLTYIGVRVYKSNQLVVTTENIIQVLQFSLLNRQVSQLNLAKIQDVSVDQKGLVQTLLNFGTIEIETAGEASNFKFPYVTNPNRVAKIIIEAHEDFIRRHGSSHNTLRV